LKSLFTHSETQTPSIWNSINEQQEKDLQKKLVNAKTLIIDSMGMLSRLYYYATVTYVGGGFKSGIHNTLEAVVYGKPILFGPKYHKFKEARDLIEAGAAFSITNSEELKLKMDHLLNAPSELSKAGNAAKKYVEENIGATRKVIQYIQENRLLTN
jgi:3-deoxy-D-manno-octulosonic-acid transferase